MIKKICAALAITAFMTTPAFAAKISVKFESDTGEAAVYVFDESNMTFTVGEHSGSYSMDVEAKKLCGSVGDGEEICATFDELGDKPEVGFSTGYKSSDGTKGTATIVAIEE